MSALAFVRVNWTRRDTVQLLLKFGLLLLPLAAPSAWLLTAFAVATALLFLVFAYVQIVKGETSARINGWDDAHFRIEITGYQASNTVNVKVRDLSILGKVLDAFVASGANQLNGPSFEVDKPDEAYDEARLAALKKAQARAQTYASALGLQVRRIVSISEGGGSAPRPMVFARAMAADGFAKETSVAPGETTLSVSIDVVFELGR